MMYKPDYYMKTSTWKPVPPETPEQRLDRKRREAEAAQRFAEKYGKQGK